MGQFKVSVVVLVCTILVNGCGDSTSPEYCVDSIDTRGVAKSITENIVYSIYDEIDGLPSDFYVDKRVSGVRGEMIINGSICHGCDYPKPIIDIHVNMKDYSRLPQIRNNITGNVNYVDEDGSFQITDDGTPIALKLDDPYVDPERGESCRHDFEDVADKITEISASGSSRNLWTGCAYSNCDRSVNPSGYLATRKRRFKF